MSPGVVLILVEVCRNSGRVCGGQGGVFLGYVHSSPIMAKDPFLRIRKKMGPMMDLEATRQSPLDIIGTE